MYRAFTAVLLLCTVWSPAMADEIDGIASFRERIAIRPGATFTATLLDISLADAPATELGRAQIENAGNPPYSFTIAFDADAVDPTSTYAVRAELRFEDRLLFTTDTVYPVLTRGAGRSVEMMMIRVGG